MRAAVFLATAAVWRCGAAARAGPLPRLNIIQSAIGISGISSGADFAAHFLVAASDVLAGAGIFAGQAPSCAVTAFAGEAQVLCSSQPAGAQGPGCVGLNTTGAAPCIGCDYGLTIAYDHCKAPPGIALTDTAQLVAQAAAAAAAGEVPPLANLRSARVFLYRGTRDTVYQDGSVNKTLDFFSALVADPATQLRFEASVPSAHCQPTIDPWLSPASCGGGAGWAPPAMENCGFDGAGAALQHIARGTLTPPPVGTRADPADVSAFDQDLYLNNTVWSGLASTGYIFVPRACAGGAACGLHIALHGCGMAAVNPAMNSSFVMHTYFNEWGATNNIVVLYPQGGGFAERHEAAPSAQLGGECYDGYGQTGIDYAVSVFLSSPLRMSRRRKTRPVTQKNSTCSLFPSPPPPPPPPPPPLFPCSRVAAPKLCSFATCWLRLAAHRSPRHHARGGEGVDLNVRGASRTETPGA